MDNETTPKINNDHVEVLSAIWSFIVKNALGIASVLFGVTAKVYIIQRHAKRVTANQCRVSAILAGLAGAIAWYVVSDMQLKDYWKAVICGYIPIVIEPITLRIVLWIDPIIDEVGKTLKSWIKKQNK